MKTEKLESPEETLEMNSRLGVAVIVIVPFLALIAGIIIQISVGGGDWITFALFVMFWLFTGFGITVGFHRCFTHTSFVIKNCWLKKILLIGGSMAAEGSVLGWVGWHRCHHKHTDKEGDPHSPHLSGYGFWNRCRGAWHAHVGWMFNPPSVKRKYVRDLLKDSDMVWASRTFKFWILAGLALPPLIGLVLRGTHSTPLTMLADFLWAGPVRLLFVHHITWSINSVCHLWGKRPFDVDDKSTNNIIFGILGNGEGWHHNHHAFQTSAKHGLLKGQFDLSWELIRLFEKLGWAEKVRVPTEEMIQNALKK